MHVVRNANHFQKSTGAEDSCSMIPAANAQPEYAEKLRKWKKDDLQEFNSQAFEEICVRLFKAVTQTGRWSTIPAETWDTCPGYSLIHRAECRHVQNLWVYDLMGLSEPEPGSPYDEAKKTFAADVLRIEICSPE
ncbi:hypothetical protein ABVK25_004501 [Lepraria finkii]|uniref:Uncharacterized protein n=1 Tax=Lepraria finkii TaxID=1340010 RepID=A0ABR4BGW5_9LECA